MNNLNLEKTPVGRLLFNLSMPSIAGLLSNALYMIINGVYLGQFVGADALGAVTIVFPIQMILFSFALLFGTGGGVLFSISFGEENYEKIKKITTSTIFFGIIVFIAASFLIFSILEPLVKIFGCTEKTLFYGKIYLLTLLPFFPFQGMMIIYENFLRSMGNSILPMIAMIFSAFLNLILGYIFVPILKYGTFGAGISTGLSQLFGFLLLYIYIKLKNYNIKLIFSKLFISFKILKEILASGFSAFANQLAFSIRALVLNIVTVYLGGENALIMVGIITRINSFVVIPVFGITHGLRPIVAYSYGRNIYKRMKNCLIIALANAFIFLTTMFVIILFFSYNIMSIFVNDSLLINYGMPILILTHIGLPIVGFNMIGSMFMQSIKKNTMAFMFSIINPLFVFIPLAIILTKTTKNIWAIWSIYPIADFVAFILMSIALLLVVKNLKKEVYSSLNFKKK